MSKHPSGRGYFFTAMAGSLIGLIFGALLVSVVPAVAGNGDPLVLGTVNKAGRSTWLASRGPSVLKLNNTAGNPALDLRVQPGAAPMSVNSDQRVIGLNADRVDEYHADQLIRVAHAETANAPDQDGDILTATITAPGPGFLVVSGSIDSGAGVAADTYQCHLRVDGVAITGSLREITVDYAGAGHTDNTEEDCSTDGVRAVAAGTHTVTLRISYLTAATFGESALWVLFIPFDGTGATPTP